MGRLRVKKGSRCVHLKISETSGLRKNNIDFSLITFSKLFFPQVFSLFAEPQTLVWGDLSMKRPVGAVLAFVSVFLVNACKQENETGVLETPPVSGKKSVNCSVVDNWLKSPLACQKDQEQVVVTKVISLPDSHLFRLNEAGTHICLGEVRHFNRKDLISVGWKASYGVWLTRKGEACQTGTKYRNANEGNKGLNAVVPFLMKGTTEKMTEQTNKVKLDFSLTARPSSIVGTLEFEQPVGQDSRILSFKLCSSEFEKRCQLSVDENTLQISLK